MPISSADPLDDTDFRTQIALGSVLYSDVLEHAIVQLDPVTGERTVLFSNAIGSGPILDQPGALAIEADGSVLVGHGVSSLLEGILRIDPITGVRSIVTTAITPTTSSISLDASGTIWVVSFNEAALYALDPVTGTGPVVSSPTVGTGPNFEIGSGVYVMPTGEIYVSNQLANSIMQVDPVTGDRTVISSWQVGAGPEIDDPQMIVRDVDGTLIVGTLTDEIFRIDPLTGDRTLITSSSIGTGEALQTAGGIALEPSGYLLVTDHQAARIFRVDPDTGDRTLLSSGTPPLAGSGDPISYPGYIVIAKNGSPLVPLASPFGLVLMIGVVGAVGARHARRSGRS